MYEKYINYLTNCSAKWSRIGQENEFLLATILGTGKSIDFYYFLYFNKGWLLPLIGLSLHLLVSLNSYYVLYLIMHWHC